MKVVSTKLVVLATATGARLAYESLVTGNRGAIPSKLHVLVDASTGGVLSTRDEVMEGSGTGWINGPTPFALATTKTGTTFSMRDPVTTNLSCQDAANNTIFSGTDDLWGNGVSTNRETGCADALFDAQTEVKMLSAWLGRNAMDGNGGAVPIRVGLADVNAYYDGTQIQVGHNPGNAWISALDVVGHEFGHMVDDHTPGGISGNGTQEAVADVFGALTEAYANEPAAFDPPDYVVGEEVNLNGNGSPIRNMYNPSLLGDPNCYSSSIPTTEVHSAAGPMNHWFYLIAQGSNPTNGNPTSPTCNSSTVGGALGNVTAGKIFYSAMLMKTTGASYLKYRTWTLTAAKNLTPTSCAAFTTVKAAWDAVSVPAQAADPTCTIGGPPVVANPGTRTSTRAVATSLQMTASGGTTPYTWSATGLPTGLTINASTGLISGTPTTAATYAVTVTASGGGTGSAAFSWAITTTAGCPSPGQKLVNPGFESGNVTWTATSGVISQPGTSEPARTGTWDAWMDGYGTTHTDSISQSVVVPTGCTTTLSFYLHIDTAETTTTVQFDKLTVTAGTTTLATFSNLNKATGYVLRTANLSAFAGQTVVLKFTGVEDNSLQTSFVVDDAAVTSS